VPIAPVNGIDIFYEDEGQGTPVLFIHGGFGGIESKLYWRRASFQGVLPADGFRTISYDRRGCGRSTFVESHFSLRDLARDARELLRYLDINSAIIVGDSLGGLVAQRFALDFPEATRSLVLVETASRIFGVGAWVRAIMFASRYLPMRPFLPLVKRRVLEPHFYDPLGPLSEEEIAGRRRHHDDYKRRLRFLSDDELYIHSMGLFRNYAVFANVDLSSETGNLRMPVDIMHGTADRVVRFELGAALLQTMPHAELHPLPDLGHGIFYYPEGRELAGQVLQKHASKAPEAAMTAGD
jgi:pimeloyl-ACP methyl ester carboxylesterase